MGNACLASRGVSFVSIDQDLLNSAFVVDIIIADLIRKDRTRRLSLRSFSVEGCSPI